MLPLIKSGKSVEIPNTNDSKGIVYRFDFHSGSYEMEDGKLVVLERLEDRVKQWLQFLLNVELKKYKIYDGMPFGISKNQYIGMKNYPLVLLESDLEDDLRRAFALNTDIKELIKVEASKRNNVLQIKVHVKTMNNVNVEVSNV